jgi:hypothetical protein
MTEPKITSGLKERLMTSVTSVYRRRPPHSRRGLWRSRPRIDLSGHKRVRLAPVRKLDRSQGDSDCDSGMIQEQEHARREPGQSRDDRNEARCPNEKNESFKVRSGFVTFWWLSCSDHAVPWHKANAQTRSHVIG